MKTGDFDFSLPRELVAQTPAEPRDSSRLLVLHRDSGRLEHRHFYEIGEYLVPGDALVLNDTRVLPARLRGKRETGGAAEVLLLRREGEGLWWALVKPGKGLPPGSRIAFGDGEKPPLAEVVSLGEGGSRLLRLQPEEQVLALGTIPLPPYIRKAPADPQRYQTVFARHPGSAAAPTAGLHFTPQLLEGLQQKGVELVLLTLHIGLDTFRPVREEDPTQHPIHQEWGELGTEAAEALNRVRVTGGRVVAVGTTSVRLLEQAHQGTQFQPFQGWCSLFILPGYPFRGVDGLVTNFHLPRSTTLMLVSAFAGWERLLEAYREAVAQGYRFYSFGDCMMIL